MLTLVILAAAVKKTR